MEKPTIFFSHSSIDKDYISCLHKKVSVTTAKTVEVFQSSDGESIPFGNNWVHKIEENLHKAKVMFVFVSPISLSSSWIYFESGFAYSRGVKVIPIGIKGVDVGSLKPPLNLLQGFNINSENGMNNIITVLNREFSCEFAESYNERDYIDLSQFDENFVAQESEFVDKINYINFNFPTAFAESRDSVAMSICDEPLNIIANKLSELGIQFGFGGTKTLYSHGLIAEQSSKNSSVNIKIDPFILSTYNEFLNGVTESLYGTDKIKKMWCNVVFNGDVSLETADFKVSSRLYKVGIEISDLHGGYFKFDDVDFTIEPEAKDKNIYSGVPEANLRIIFNTGSFNSSTIVNLLSCLVKTNIVK